MADGLSRHLCGDVITPVPPPPAPSPVGRGCAAPKFRAPPKGEEGVMHRQSSAFYNLPSDF